MSYSLIDETGDVRDLATNAGLQQLMLAVERDSPLAQFLAAGEANDELRQKISEQGTVSEDGKWEYIPELFSELTGHVLLSNGLEEDMS